MAKGHTFGKNTNKPYHINKEIKIQLILMNSYYHSVHGLTFRHLSGQTEEDHENPHSQ